MSNFATRIVIAWSVKYNWIISKAQELCVMKLQWLRRWWFYACLIISEKTLVDTVEQIMRNYQEPLT